MDDLAIEKIVKEKGLNAPRVTLDGIKAKIDTVTYLRDTTTALTVCKITLKNGFSFIGHTAAASPENYDKELSDQISYDNAFRQIWSHEAYLLKEVLHQAKIYNGRQQGGGPDPDDLQASLGQKAHE